MTIYVAEPVRVTTAPGHQNDSSIAALADGGWIVTWMAPDTDGSGIYQQRYSKAGVAIGGEIRVNAHEAGRQLHSRVVGLADGGWVVTWSSTSQSGDVNFYQQRYDASGQKLWATGEHIVHSSTSGEIYAPAVAALQNGGWVVAWTAMEGNDYNVYQQHFNANGEAAGAVDSVVSVNTEFGQKRPSVAAMADGGWIVTWMDEESGQKDAIYQRRFSPDGQPQSSTDILVQGDAMEVQTNPIVTALSDGGWVVTWMYGYGVKIFQQRFRPEGTALWTESRQVNVANAELNGMVTVVATADGGWLVVWEAGNSRGFNQRHYDGNGQPSTAGDQFIAGSEGGYKPSATGLRDGGWVISFGSWNEANGEDIYQQRFQPNQAPTGISLVAPAPIAEASAIGTQVGTLQGSDINLGFGDSLTYTLLDDGGGRFVLDGGRLLVADGLRLDYEQAASHTIRVRATDRDGLSVEQDLAVQVGDVANEAVIGSAGVDHLAGGAGNDRFQGLEGDDLLAGGAGNDTLDGGLGADRLDGGTGNDTYLIDNAGDVVTETAGGGSDVVQTSVSYTLAAGVEVEFLTALGAGQVNLTGNEYANMLTGNGAANILKGEAGHDTLDGGVGADTLEGGLGGDVYLVDNAGDVILEAVGGGSDAIRTGIGYTLAAGVEVELLTAAGAGRVNLTGNGFANTLVGNAGVNTLKGGAGNDMLFGKAGKDVLYGGTGRDTFVFDSRWAKKNGNVDKVMDFSVRDDTIHLENGIFAKLGRMGSPTKPVKLDSKMFWIGASAHDANDRIIYDKATGALYYDDDGTGRHAQVKIASLKKGLGLTKSDFHVI
jgi:Ca2+-binding RTX toxin-like protein